MCAHEAGMTQSEIHPVPRRSIIRSLVAVIIGSLLLRAAAGAMGENIQFYFNAIHQAASDPTAPLRTVVGAGHVYPITYTLGGMIIGVSGLAANGSSFLAPFLVRSPS